MPPVWLQLLALALQSAPTVMSEVQSAVTQHWGKDHVQQLVHGTTVLNQIAATVATVQAQQQAAAQSPGSSPVN